MIDDLKQIKKLLNAKKIGPVFFVTPNPNRGIGLEKILRNYHIICSQNYDVVDLLKQKKVSVFCLNDKSLKSSGKILENKKVLDFIKKKAKKSVVNIITFKPSPKIQKICLENDFRYLGNDWKLNRELEDKVEFVEITKKLKISNAESRKIKLKDNDKFKKEFVFKNSQKYVIQLSRGFSGNSTFLIENEIVLKNILKKYNERVVKISNFKKGDTYTINACLGRFGIVISRPIFQITGLTTYNKNKFGTSGNDYSFSKNLRSKEKDKIFYYTEKIGKYLKRNGYRGIFGLDFIVSDDQVDLIEINPRLIASIPVFTKLQLEKKQFPFLLFHLLEFLEIDYKENLFLQKNEKGDSFDFSQLILRNTRNSNVKIKKSLASGIYGINNNKLVFKKKIYFAENLKKNEFLIQAVKVGSIISPDLEYANIQIGCGIMISSQEFQDSFKKIIKIVSDSIVIQ